MTSPIPTVSHRSCLDEAFRAAAGKVGARGGRGGRERPAGRAGHLRNHRRNADGARRSAQGRAAWAMEQAGRRMIPIVHANRIAPPVQDFEPAGRTDEPAGAPERLGAPRQDHDAAHLADQSSPRSCCAPALAASPIISPRCRPICGSRSARPTARTRAWCRRSPRSWRATTPMSVCARSSLDGGTRAAAAAIDKGEADLAVIRRDTGMPKEGQVVAILRKNVVVFIVPSAAEPAKADEGAKAKPAAAKAKEPIEQDRGAGRQAPRRGRPLADQHRAAQGDPAAVQHRVRQDRDADGRRSGQAECAGQDQRHPVRRPSTSAPRSATATSTPSCRSARSAARSPPTRLPPPPAARSRRPSSRSAPPKPSPSAIRSTNRPRSRPARSAARRRGRRRASKPSGSTTTSSPARRWASTTVADFTKHLFAIRQSAGRRIAGGGQDREAGHRQGRAGAGASRRRRLSRRRAEDRSSTATAT